VASPLQVVPLPVDANQSVNAALLEDKNADPPLKLESDVPASPDHREDRADFGHVSAVSELREAISTGSYQLDSLLQCIVETAQKLTDATGAAIAMWKDGAVVCRASCGQGAPPLGAHLSVESGISGHCLRSGLVQHCGETLNDPRVDADLCRQLGLHSVAVLPIRGWRGVNGILEVFSTEPRAFAEQHFDLLQHLAELAERARAGQPDAPAVAPAMVPSAPASGLLPASDRVRDLATILISSKRRTLVLGTIAAVGLLLLGLVIWLGWRNPDGVKATVNAAAPASARTTPINFQRADPTLIANSRPQPLFGSKPSPNVSLSPRLNTPPKKSTPTEPARSSEDSSLSDTVVRHVAPAAPPAVESATIEPPPLVASIANPTTLNSLLSTSPEKPQLTAVAVSQGLSNGYLVHRVPPVYPAQALTARLEGTVVMNALIAEDGTVQDLKLVSGQPTLAHAALEAVRQWRYKPYELDRKPVKMNTTITVKFKLP